MMRATPIGISVNEIKSEQSKAMIMETPAWPSQMERFVSWLNTSGTKIITEVSVAAETALKTCCGPSRAAWTRSFPFSSCW